MLKQSASGDGRSSQTEGYILLRDMQGAKEGEARGVFRRKSVATVPVMRGELIKRGPNLDYNLHRDSSVSLQCSPGDVGALHNEEFLLLEAIADPRVRLKAYQHKLDWGVSVKEGSTVQVSIAGGDLSRGDRAVVHYKGKIGDKAGTFFGMELLETSHRANKIGTTDGSFQGRRYFSCQNGCVLFCTLCDIESPKSASKVEALSEEMVELRDLLSPKYLKLLRDSKDLQNKVDVLQSEKETLVQAQAKLQVQVKDLTDVSVDQQAEIQRKAELVHARDEAIENKDAQIAHLEQQLKQYTQVLAPSSNEQWNVPRSEIDKISKKQIGFGAWGLVYSAKFQGQDVAIKVAHQQIFHESTIDMLKREVTIMSNLQHPNLVRFIAAVWDDAVELKVDTPIIISELMDMNLRDAYKRKLDLSDSLVSIFRDVAFALHYLHQHCQPIIHRDVSAPNVLLKSLPNGAYHAKVSDFGSANLVKQSKTAGAGAIVYCAPEMFPKEDISVPPQPQTTKVDVFSYGILLLEVMCKEMPTMENRHSLLQRIKRELKTIYDLIVHCTKVSPSDRPTMANILNQLNGTDLITGAHVKQEFHPSQNQSAPRAGQISQRPRREQSSELELQFKCPGENLDLGQTTQGPPTDALPGVDRQGEVLPSSGLVASSGPLSTGEADPSHCLGVGSLIQLPATDGSVKYGTIKWIGLIRNVQGNVAGIELEEPMEGCNDGTFQGTRQKFFNCPHGTGLYYPLKNLRPDHRWAPQVGNPLRRVRSEELDTPAPGHLDMYIGNERGIQGHQNSCYLDATLFGLFAISDEFDAMFLNEKSDIGRTLWRNIVNPLRKNGVVKYECVMRLREQLDKLGQMKGITQDEKDPEEFLNLMLKHTLHATPFVSIRHPFGVGKEYFVQLFSEMDGAKEPPSIGNLLEKMFLEQHISFTEVPSKLLIQVPRFGKKFQTFQKIIPDKTINVASIVDVQGKCFFCDEGNARHYCPDCKPEYSDPTYCDCCLERAHARRPNHDRVGLTREAFHIKIMADLELLSVICIETSHYVCFTRQEDRWIFFDSMANRVYDKYDIPKVDECTRDLNNWVYPPGGDISRLLNTPPRELPEYVRRFTQDIYMCVYIQPGIAMYA